MNSAGSNSTRPLPWYRVGTMWLVVLLLGTVVVASVSMVFTTLRHPDVHLSVPNDVPRSSKLPPIRDHGELAPAKAEPPADAPQQ